MDISTITINDFKGLFTRGFPFLPVWEITKTYKKNDVVYYDIDGLFYQCAIDGTVGGDPTDENWAIIADEETNYILDADITESFEEAEMNFNQSLFDTDAMIKKGFLYLAAHYLVMDMRTALKGINSSGEQMVASRSIGSVSESYSIPQQYADNPIFSYYAQTGYGQKYLNMVMPRLVGNVQVAGGWTQP